MGMGAKKDKFSENQGHKPGLQPRGKEKEKILNWPKEG